MEKFCMYQLSRGNLYGIPQCHRIDAHKKR